MKDGNLPIAPSRLLSWTGNNDALPFELRNKLLLGEHIAGGIDYLPSAALKHGHAGPWQAFIVENDVEYAIAWYVSEALALAALVEAVKQTI